MKQAWKDGQGCEGKQDNRKAGKKAVVVPNHKKIDKGTLLEIIRQAGLTKEEFINLTK